MILHIDVKNKVATYQTRDGCIVCGNSGYQIEFNFDDEWANVTDKKAVIISPNGTEKVSINASGVCNLPIIRNASKITVGVHSESVGMTTTGTEIPCKKSILCQ